jgi:nitrile hydratase subunit beta
MKESISPSLAVEYGVVWAGGEAPQFKVQDKVRIGGRSPIGHYRVPTYLRGKEGVVTKVIEPAAIDNEEEGYGRNAGSRLHYYRVAFRMRDIWSGYVGSARDELHIEIFETWLERI